MMMATLPQAGLTRRRAAIQRGWASAVRGVMALQPHNLSIFKGVIVINAWLLFAVMMHVRTLCKEIHG